MKNLFLVVLIAFLSSAMIGCGDDDDCIVCGDPAPATPQGVYSVTGDDEVRIYWNGIYDHDVEEYLIYYSFDPVENYEVMAAVPAQDNPNLDLLIYEYIDDDVDNGTTYYYAVAAVDYAGQVSELSAENVFDTPRPEGTVMLYPDVYAEGRLSGFDLSAPAVVYDTSVYADIYIDTFQGIWYINVTNPMVDIQDMGFTSDWDEIGWAPDSAWSELGFMELMPGHTYVIWTADDHFAKMRLSSINPDGSVSFQWAYQTDQSNPELAPPVDMDKPVHGPDYLVREKGFALLK